jgi:allophanate hydrolase subunit 2
VFVHVLLTLTWLVGKTSQRMPLRLTSKHYKSRNSSLNLGWAAAVFGL